ncbi:MAG: PQQ-binding-like beta-propeller repeat protein [Planctomycetota bacterium]|nr:PQQ-binding-like beta-propeller repeat protein [Planctomycetota bacterium]
MRIAAASLLLLLSQPLAAQVNWPQFRGPHGNGHVDSESLPLEWGESKNICWKMEIHDRGWSSPVIWKNQVWLTTATRDGKKMYAVCVDRESGKLIHDFQVFEVASPQRIATENSYATPTSVIDENHVYVHYGTYGTACFERQSGRKIWERRDLNCDHELGAGPASSPMLVDNLFVVNVDGRDFQYVIALDRKTGETVWKTDRSVDFSQVPVNQRKAYGMPALFQVGDQPQLVSNGGKGLYAYAPRTGKEIWRVRHHGFSQAPRPVYGHGLVFTTVDRDNPELWAIRADGKGDVTESHVAWKEKRAMPRRCSPLLIGDQIYLVSRNGVISCLEAQSGKTIWRERVPGSYSASPIYACNLIYLFNDDNITTIIRPGKTLDVVATNRLNRASVMASPAVSGKSLFIRTESHLYRIENRPSP